MLSDTFKGKGMILQAFSTILHREKRQTGLSAEVILNRWLRSILLKPFPEDNIARVIHTEVAMLYNHPEKPIFSGKSATGETLLKSLYKYCESYEHWQFSRWVHEVKPHHFNQLLR